MVPNSKGVFDETSSKMDETESLLANASSDEWDGGALKQDVERNAPNCDRRSASRRLGSETGRCCLWIQHQCSRNHTIFTVISQNGNLRNEAKLPHRSSCYGAFAGHLSRNGTKSGENYAQSRASRKTRRDTTELGVISHLAVGDEVVVDRSVMKKGQSPPLQTKGEMGPSKLRRFSTTTQSNSLARVDRHESTSTDATRLHAARISWNFGRLCLMMPPIAKPKTAITLRMRTKSFNTEHLTAEEREELAEDAALDAMVPVRRSSRQVRRPQRLIETMHISAETDGTAPDETMGLRELFEMVESERIGATTAETGQNTSDSRTNLDEMEGSRDPTSGSHSSRTAGSEGRGAWRRKPDFTGKGCGSLGTASGTLSSFSRTGRK